MYNITFPWSDNWWIEKNIAYFCAGRIGAIFCVNMDSQECKFLAQIPDCHLYNFRLYSYCVKYRNVIFCLPSWGKCIWCFCLEKREWKKIEVRNEKQLQFSAVSYVSGCELIRLIETETKNIYEINLDNVKIRQKYQNEFAVTGLYVIVGSKFYGITARRICFIDMASKKTDIFSYSEIKSELYTICYDGTNFWLSGYGKEVYVWNPQLGIIKTINKFPKDFGMYNYSNDGKQLVDCNSYLFSNPFFADSFALGEYIWFIPFQANQVIYINKYTFCVYELKIEEEIETQESLLKNKMNHKYLVEYIRENRYIGLYSLKNKRIFEIDTVEICIIIKKYKLTDKTVSKLADIFYDEHGILNEGANEMHKEFFCPLVNKSYGDEKSKSFLKQSIGETIYNKMIL